MRQYQELLRELLWLVDGKPSSNRTGVATYGLFGYQMRFNMADGFPAITTKKLAWKAVVSELLWFLEGSTNERRLAEILHGTKDRKNQTIWTANAENQGKALGYDAGELGPVYGKQWRDFGGVDQLAEVVENLIKSPGSRRHIVSAWNPPEIPKMALPPCHCLFQFNVRGDRLDLQLYQRSCDVFLGLPFNIASYALLLEIVAAHCDLIPGEFIWTGGDVHLYENHTDAALECLSREPLALPRLRFNKEARWDKHELDEFTLEGYQSYPAIPADMAV